MQMTITDREAAYLREMVTAQAEAREKGTGIDVAADIVAVLDFLLTTRAGADGPLPAEEREE